jgi:hypothetical protein
MRVPPRRRAESAVAQRVHEARHCAPGENLPDIGKHQHLNTPIDGAHGGIQGGCLAARWVAAHHVRNARQRGAIGLQLIHGVDINGNQNAEQVRRIL